MKISNRHIFYYLKKFPLASSTFRFKHSEYFVKYKVENVDEILSKKCNIKKMTTCNKINAFLNTGNNPNQFILCYRHDNLSDDPNTIFLHFYGDVAGKNIRSVFTKLKMNIDLTGYTYILGDNSFVTEMLNLK